MEISNGMEIEKPAEGKPKEKSGWELFRFLVFILILAFGVRVFLAQPFVVSGSSMVPTFQDKNYLIVDKVSYKLGDPERDDVIIFRYPKDPTKFFIKRIIGLPNETVDINSSEITVTNEEHKEGFRLVEPYVKNHSENKTHFELGDNEYFVMGDNRSASSDSRFWGAVPRKLIVGRALVRLWPLNEIDTLPGKYTQSE